MERRPQNHRARWQGPIPAGALVYAKRDHARMLFREILHKRARIVLVTSDSDDPVIEGARREAPSQISAWYSTNSTDSLLTAIPLGLGNSYCPVPAKGRRSGIGCVPQSGCDKWLLVNFRSETNPSIGLKAIEIPMPGFCRNSHVGKVIKSDWPTDWMRWGCGLARKKHL